MDRARLFSAVLLVVLVSWRTTGLCIAQEDLEEPTPAGYSFTLIDVSLDEALYTLIDKTDIQLFFESTLVAGKIVYCRVEGASEEEALLCILDGTGLDYIRQSGGLYVIVLSNRQQPTSGAVFGQVMDIKTEEPLPDAAIILLDDNTGTTTNAGGRFAFHRLIPGVHKFTVSHVAYEPVIDSVEVISQTSQMLSIALKRRTVLAMPIVVQAPPRRGIESELSQHIGSELLQRPGVEPTPTILEALNTVIGVNVGNALADVHVQGGNAGEHQYLLDGAPVFVPLRSTGFFGSFSPYALQQITVRKAGFEARHGSYLSGSIDMTHDVVPDNSSMAVVQVDPLSVNARLHGVIEALNQVQINWMTTGRVSLWRFFQPAPIDRSMRIWSEPNAFIYEALSQDNNVDDPLIALGGDSPLSFSFSDLHAAARIRLPGARSLYLSLYRGRNRFGLEIGSEEMPEEELSEEEYSWNNQTRLLRYESVWGRRGFFRATAWQSDYRLRHPLDRDPFSSFNSVPIAADSTGEDFNEILVSGVKLEFDLYATVRHLINGGLETTYTESEFELSLDPFDQTPAIDDNNVYPAQWLSSSYLQDVISLSARTQLTAGSRFTYIYGQKRLYAEPRINVSHEDRSARWMFQAAAGLYRQYVDQFDVASYNLTTLLPSFRFWIPISREARAPAAYHLAGNILYSPSRNVDVRIETYYKFQPRLRSLDFHQRLEPIDNSVSGLITARGYAYGGSLSLDYTRSSFRFRARYEYALARRKIAGRFDNRYVSTPWQIPHHIFSALDFTSGRNWTMTARWQTKWGQTWAFRPAYYDYLEPDPLIRQQAIYDFSDPEHHRLPAFNQLDFGIAYKLTLQRIGIQARLSVLNLFDTKNTVEWILENAPNSSEIILKTRESPRIYPSASIRIQY